ncbi:MAG: hypothetical protein KDI30_09800 [Pseudomonadales bacterium]|nr:hypothetical protein [Pseudomonadales bacterium]
MIIFSLSRTIKTSCYGCFVALLCFSSLHLHAIENSGYLCQLGNQVRAIHIVYPNKTLVPCEVQYIKNGTLQVLWSAQNQTGYCERKASEFVEKQKGWGWTCSVRSLTSFVKPKTSLPNVTFTAIPAEE